MKLQGKKINFLGDSITEGHGASSNEKCFVSLIEKMAELGVARNYGIGGTRIAIQNGVDNLKWDTNAFTQRFDKMDDDADIVVVFGGTNDFGHGNAPIGTFTDRDPETFYGACHYLFAGLSRKYLGKPIVVITPLHRCSELERRENGLDLKDYVNIIREVAEYYSLYVLDLFKHGGIQPSIPAVKQAYMPDGLHPNDAGYELLAKKIMTFLEQI